MMNQKYALQKVFLNMDDGEFLYPVSFHGRYAVDEFMYNARTHFRRLFRVQRMSEQELANWQTVIERHLGCTSKELDYGEYEWYSVEVLAYCQKNNQRKSLMDITALPDIIPEDTEALRWFAYNICNVPEDEVNYFATVDELMKSMKNMEEKNHEKDY